MSLVCVYCTLQPPSGDVESSVPYLGGELEMKTVLLSIQSSIEQVEEGGA